jgi:hypothetical protein
VCENIDAMTPRARAAWAIAAVPVVLGVGGCGGGSNSTTASVGQQSTSAAVVSGGTHAQFVAHAQAICEQLVSSEKPLRVRQEALKAVPAASASQTFAALAQQFLSLSSEADAKLQALPRPRGEAITIEKLLVAYGAEENDVANIAHDVKRQESSTGEAVESALKRVVRENSRLSEGFGMKGCIDGE